MRILMLSLAVVFAWPTLSFSHGGHHHHHHDHNHEPKNLEEFLDSAHHEIGTHGPESEKLQEKVKEFLKAMNPQELLIRTIRWYNIRSQDSEFYDHVKNISVLIFITELVELLTGPTTTLLVNIYDWPTWVDASIQGVGYFISTPFIVNASWLGPLSILAEPVCATTLVSYKFFPGFRNGVTRARMYLQRKTKGFCDTTGISSLANRIFPKVDKFYSLSNHGWAVTRDGHGQPIELTYSTAEGGSIVLSVGEAQGHYIKSVMAMGVSRREFKSALSPMNWSARKLLLDGFSKEPEPQLKEREVLLKDKRSFCTQALSISNSSN